MVHRWPSCWDAGHGGREYHPAAPGDPTLGQLLTLWSCGQGGLAGLALLAVSRTLPLTQHAGSLSRKAVLAPTSFSRNYPRQPKIPTSFETLKPTLWAVTRI